MENFLAAIVWLCIGIVIARYFYVMGRAHGEIYVYKKAAEYFLLPCPLPNSNKQMTLFTEVPTSQLEYAKGLATYLWKNYYRDKAPNWKPQNDMMGVLTQIDNMIANLPEGPSGSAATSEYLDGPTF